MCVKLVNLNIVGYAHHWTLNPIFLLNSIKVSIGVSNSISYRLAPSSLYHSIPITTINKCQKWWTALLRCKSRSVRDPIYSVLYSNSVTTLLILPNLDGGKSEWDDIQYTCRKYVELLTQFAGFGNVLPPIWTPLQWKPVKTRSVKTRSVKYGPHL